VIIAFLNLEVLYKVEGRYGDLAGSLATTNCELRQAWKGATVTVNSCAGVWLTGSPPFNFFICLI